MMKRIGLYVFILLLSACGLKQESLPFLSEGVSLQKAKFADLEGFDADDLSAGLQSFEKSCDVLLKNTSKMKGAAIDVSAEKYQKICRDFKAQKPLSNEDAARFLEKHFVPYLVLYNGSPKGRFTSYYEAEIKASRTKHGVYQVPIYGKPNDLIEFNPAAFDDKLPSQRLVGRIEKNKLVPYYTRAEIEQRKLDAPVILWADDAVDVFLMQIQGSALATLDDGSQIRVRYADNNGQKFVGIGSIMLKEKQLPKGGASMDKIRDWLKQNPEKAKKFMAENPRYVFHKFSDAEGPVGALGAPLTAGRSLAVDKTFIPLGSLLWLETTAPDQTPIRKLVSAQDIGGAIKGAVRGDYFWGHGEEALLSAGKMHAEGKYYIFLPKGSEPVVHE